MPWHLDIHEVRLSRRVIQPREDKLTGTEEASSLEERYEVSRSLRLAAFRDAESPHEGRECECAAEEPAKGQNGALV